MSKQTEEQYTKYAEAQKWIAAWVWCEGCVGLEVYIGITGVTLKKFGIQIFAPTITEAVALALKEGWGYERD